MLLPDESLVHSAERRLEARTYARIQSITQEFTKRLGAIPIGESVSLQRQKADTERAMQSAIHKVEVSYGSHKKQLELLKGGGTERRGKAGKGGKGGDGALQGEGETRNKLSYLAELEKDVKNTIQGHCFRLQHMQQANSIKEVLLYLSLRSQGCPRQSAINFASKLRCRIDSTQRKDGPSSMRTIRRLNNQKDGVNVNGWQLHSPKYRLKSEFQLYKMKEDEIDYESVRSGFERFERGHRIINGEVHKKDPIMDFDHCPSVHSLRSLPTHRRITSLPTLPAPLLSIPTTTVSGGTGLREIGLGSSRKKLGEAKAVERGKETGKETGKEGENDEEKSLIRAAPTMDTSAVVSTVDVANSGSRQGLTPVVLPEIKVKAFHSRVKIVDDAVDSVQAEPSCVCTFRSLKPDHTPPPPPFSKARRATVLTQPYLSRSPQRRSTCEFRKRGDTDEKCIDNN